MTPKLDPSALFDDLPPARISSTSFDATIPIEIPSLTVAMAPIAEAQVQVVEAGGVRLSASALHGRRRRRSSVAALVGVLAGAVAFATMYFAS